jgi:fibrillarin-like rRNA methylase
VIYARESEVLRHRGFNVEEVLPLEPYDKAHAMIVAQRSQA